ncbi:Six-hairpin glycosidase-like protein [Crassisporium funariophilum]|nr:Six-hairpin glycosidase-like protein [Crassisporium funariophilum]
MSFVHTLRHHRSSWLRVLALVLSLTLFSAPDALAQNLTDGQINVVSARLAESAQASWELGTRSQAILELNASSYSVFSTNSIPPPATVPSNLTAPLTPFFAIAKTTVSNRAKSNDNFSGPQPLMADGSAADPASIGMSVLLANWTGQDGGDIDYAGAATDQLDYLFQKVPMTSDGAISHRVEQVQLWSDFVYMVPPFLAYYGVVTRNRSVVEESYNQIKLYRNYLRDPKQNLWKHILLGSSGNDQGFWSTGNGWAAGGMLRVLATMKRSEYANTFKNEQNDLANWVREIHSGMYPHLSSQNLFTNYADQPATAPGNFYDASSTALLASTVYRAAVLLNQHTYLPFAERTRMELFNSTSDSTPTSNGTAALNGFEHLTPQGWLTPVVDPHAFGQKGQESPEGQAFVVEMHAAWRDWVLDGSRGANGARSGRLSARGWILAVTVMGGLLV